MTKVEITLQNPYFELNSYLTKPLVFSDLSVLNLKGLNSSNSYLNKDEIVDTPSFKKPRISMSQQYATQGKPDEKEELLGHSQQIEKNDEPSEFMSFDDLIKPKLNINNQKEEKKQNSLPNSKEDPPDFSVVSDEILISMMKNYGMKKCSRSQMIKLLTEIWNYEANGIYPSYFFNKVTN